MELVGAVQFLKYYFKFCSQVKPIFCDSVVVWVNRDVSGVGSWQWTKAEAAAVEET